MSKSMQIFLKAFIPASILYSLAAAASAGLFLQPDWRLAVVIGPAFGALFGAVVAGLALAYTHYAAFRW